MLDNRTFMVAGLAVSLVLFLAMLVISFATRRYRGLGWWTMGNCLDMLSFAGFVFQDYTPPWYLSLLLANSASLAGLICWDYGVRRFLGQPLPLRTGLANLLLVTGLLHYYSAWQYDISLRVVIISLAYAPWCLDTARVLWREREISSPATRKSLALTALALAGFCVFRALATFFNPPVDTLFQSNWLVSLAVAIFIMAVTLFNICFLALVAVRHERDLQAKILELNQEIALRHALEERLSREATLDPLTGVANRRKLEDLAAKCLAVARRHDRPFAMLILDIDQFKQINDLGGHQAGDAALIALAELCQRQLREEDTLARFGGDEFLALLPHTDLDQALETAERLRREIETQGRQAGCPYASLTISLGVSVFQPGDAGLESLLLRADAALYRAKANGRNRVCQALLGPEDDLVLHCLERTASPA